MLTKGSIAVLSTSLTATSDYAKNLSRDFAMGKKVHFFGSQRLVHLAEEKFFTNRVDFSAVESELAAIKAIDDLAVLVLACTHFPLLAQEMRLVLGDVPIVEPSEAVARQILTLLTLSQPLPLKPEKNTFSLHCTGDDRLWKERFAASKVQ
jgi:glutamate racemase